MATAIVLHSRVAICMQCANTVVKCSIHVRHTPNTIWINDNSRDNKNLSLLINVIKGTMCPTACMYKSCTACINNYRPVVTNA